MTCVGFCIAIGFSSAYTRTPLSHNIKAMAGEVNDTDYLVTVQCFTLKPWVLAFTLTFAPHTAKAAQNGLTITMTA